MAERQLITDSLHRSRGLFPRTPVYSGRKRATLPSSTVQRMGPGDCTPAPLLYVVADPGVAGLHGEAGPSPSHFWFVGDPTV